MKGIIVGYEPIDYVSKKTNQPVKGATIYMNCKSSDAFGYVGKSEFISESSLFSTVRSDLCLKSSITRAARFTAQRIEIDYDVTNRGGRTFTAITDITITLPEKSEKKGA